MLFTEVDSSSRLTSPRSPKLIVPDCTGDISGEWYLASYLAVGCLGSRRDCADVLDNDNRPIRCSCEEARLVESVVGVEWWIVRVSTRFPAVCALSRLRLGA
jgi:hypothetical protein